MMGLKKQEMAASIKPLSRSPSQRYRKMRKRLFPWLLIIPCLVVLLGVGLAPTIYVFRLAFSKHSFIQPWEYVGLANFSKAFDDPRFWFGMRITGWFVTVSVGIQLCLGLLTAWALTRIGYRLRVFVLTGMLTPMLLAPTLVGLIWKMLFKARYGAPNYLLSLVGIEGPEWLLDTNAALAAVTIADVWQWTPFMTLLLFAGWQSLSQEVHEAAYVDGASLFQAFLYITLPLLKPFIFLAVFLRMIDAFKTFDVIWGVTKGGPGTATESIALYTHLTGFTKFDLGYAAAMSVIQLIIIIVLGQILLTQLSRANRERQKNF